MRFQAYHMLMMCLGFGIVIGLYDKSEIKLIFSNTRLSGITDSKTVRSVLECSYFFLKSENSFSFNFKMDENICELSEKRPEEDSAVTEAEGWNVYAPIEGNYYIMISSVKIPWQDAKVQCEKMSGSLVIVDDQEEQLFLENIIDLKHWIGLTCDDQEMCQWIDGRNVTDGFQAWYPGEPSYGMTCVWMGYRGGYWDDTKCIYQRKFICEF